MVALRILLVALVVAVPLLVLATPAQACECVRISLEENVAQAELIVVAEPADFRLLGPLPTPEPLSPPTVGRQDWNGPPADISVSVREYLKGDGPSTLIVRERRTVVDVVPGEPVSVRPMHSAGCGTFNTLDGLYLLFLYRRPDGLYSGGVCGGSFQITTYNLEEWAADHIQQIRQTVAAQAAEAKVLPPLGSGPQPPHSLPWPAFVTVAGAGLLLTSTALFLRRR